MPRLFGGPTLRDSIGSNHHAGAVHAIPAMNEYLFIRVIAQNREEFCDTVISHVRALRWNRHVFHSQLCHPLALIIAVASQIHHDANAHFGQRAESVVRRLSTAKKRGRYLTEIRHTLQSYFLRKHTFCRSDRSLRVFLCASRTAQNQSGNSDLQSLRESQNHSPLPLYKMLHRCKK